MTEAYQFLINQIGQAFNVMANWELFPGVSLLVFCITILLLSIVISVLWINFREDNVFYGGKHRRDKACHCQESLERKKHR